MSGAMSRSRLDGRVVLVVGGAGHVGAAVAAGCLDAGARVVIADLDQSLGASQAAAAGEAMRFEHVDLESESETRDLVPRTLRHWGRLDVIVHAAAIVGTSGKIGWLSSFETQTFDIWRRALEVNLTAPVVLTQAAVPALKETRGNVIFIGSIYGVVGPDLRLYEGTGMGSPAAYAASKGGLAQMTRWLSTVLAPAIRVNAVSLGGLARGQDPRFVKAYVDRTPLGRMGTEDDAVGAVVFLASDAAAWITGQNLIVDGGWTAW